MNDIREDLKAYVDGELRDQRASEVRDAIAANPELAEEAEFMKVLGLEIRRAATDPEIVGRESAVEKIRRSRRLRISPFTSWPFGLQAAAVIALVAIVGSITFPVLTRNSGAFTPASTMNAKEATGTMPADAAVDAPGDKWKAKSPLQSRKRSESGTGESTEESAPAKDREFAAGRRSNPASAVETNSPTIVPIRPTNRQVIKNADLTCRVASVADAMAKAGSISEGLGGFVVSSQASDLKGERPTGMVIVRVPSTRFDAAMKSMRALGEVTSENSSGQDVTAEVADIGARLKVLRNEEESYVAMLRSARKLGEIMEIKDRLSMVRQEIESLTAQASSLKDLAALSTITANFEQIVTRATTDPTPRGAFQETWDGSINGLQEAIHFLGRVLIVVFVFSPIWLPIIAILWWLAKRTK